MKKTIVFLLLLWVCNDIFAIESYQTRLKRAEVMQNRVDYFFYNTNSGSWSDDEIGAVIATYGWLAVIFDECVEKMTWLTEQQRHKYTLFAETCGIQYERLSKLAYRFSGPTYSNVWNSFDKWLRFLQEDGNFISFRVRQ